MRSEQFHELADLLAVTAANDQDSRRVHANNLVAAHAAE